MHQWLCPIRLIHPILLKFLFFKKKTPNITHLDNVWIDLCYEFCEKQFLDELLAGVKLN